MQVCYKCILSFSLRRASSSLVEKIASPISKSKPVAVSVAPDISNKVQAPDGTTWSCPRCTLNNKDTASVCGACGCPKPSSHPAKGAFAPPNTWVCGRCTLRNGRSVDVCQACHLPRVASPARSPADNSPKAPIARAESVEPSTSNSDPKMWTCRQCTFQNSVNLTECKVCDMPRSWSPSAAAAASASTSPAEGAIIVEDDDDEDMKPGPHPRGIMRQKTVCMETVRQKEEKEALERWNTIIEFCKAVSIIY